jgi:hypothetical protein
VRRGGGLELAQRTDNENHDGQSSHLHAWERSSRSQRRSPMELSASDYQRINERISLLRPHAHLLARMRMSFA